jgi:branched-chain amino acid transport system permease protein
LLLPAGALAAAAVGAILEPTLLRPLYRRAEEYQLLATFGLLMILEDVMRFLWGPYPLSASTLFEKAGSVSIGGSRYPTYNLLVIGIGGLAALFLWAFVYKTRFGVVPSQSAVLGMGVDALVLAFVVVVIGGLGSLEGALVGALIVGVVREIGISVFPEIELAVLYLIAVIVLLVRPAGLFGRAA